MRKFSNIWVPMNLYRNAVNYGIHRLLNSYRIFFMFQTSKNRVVLKRH